MAVISDIIESNSGNLTLAGWEFTRIFFVSELSSLGSDMLVEATFTPGVPLRGDSHPSVATAYVFELIPESITTAGNQVRITVIYREFDVNYEYTTDTGVQLEEFTDYRTDQVNDVVEPMVLQYTYPEDYKNEPKVAGKDDTQGVAANIFRMRPGATIARNERLSIAADTLDGTPIGTPLTNTILEARGRNFATKLNLNSWAGEDPKKYICLGIRSVSILQGLAFRVSYSFSYDINEWTYKATFRDPTTGDPVPDPVQSLPSEDGSQKRFPQYLTVDFDLLQLE